MNLTEITNTTNIIKVINQLKIKEMDTITNEVFFGVEISSIDDYILSLIGEYIKS
jgi:hypothetical protein